MLSVSERHVALDQDGVIVDTERDGHRVAFNRTFAEFGFAVEWGVEEYHELLQVGGGKERMTQPVRRCSLRMRRTARRLPRFSRYWPHRSHGMLLVMTVERACSWRGRTTL